MPYKRRYRKRKRKSVRRYRKRRRPARNKISNLRLRQLSAVPDTMFLKLKYVTTQASTASSFIFARNFALNGMFDVDLTGIGHQPKAFDQWMAFYDAYEVRASSCAMTVTNMSSTMPIYSSIYPAIESSPQTTIANIKENPYSTVKMAGVLSSGKNIRSLKSYMSVKKLEGRNIDSINYIGSSTANPAIVRHWHTQVLTQDETTNLEIEVVYTLVFYCRFFRRKILGPS